MKRSPIPSVDIEQFLATNHEDGHGDGFFITNDIYPYLQTHPARIAFYAIALCNGGLYRTGIDLAEYSITANSFMALKPHQLVNQLEIKDYSGMLLIFNKDFFLRSEADLRLLESLRFFNESAIPVVTFPEASARGLMDELIMLRFKSSRTDHPYRKEIVRNLLVNLLYEADALYRKECPDDRRASGYKEAGHKEDWAIRFQELLQKHYKERHDVQFYAESLYISPKYLSEVLREAIGKNASELIYDALLAEAKLLLKNTSFSVAQVAETLHFSDASAFIHFFRKHAGISPLAYRKS